jgi:hypothetical protein
MRRSPLVLVLSLFLSAPAISFAGPVLTEVTPRSWTFQITDGTSNTIFFGENTRFTLCLPRTTTGGFTDGTSNTILFGEATGVRIQWSSRYNGITDGTSNTILLSESSPLECFDGTGRPDPLIDTINDGTSNTIVFGEEPFQLRDQEFDACFTQANVSITDGTSNTILLGEQRCFSDVRVGGNVRIVQTPAPPLAALLALAVPAWRLYRRRV